jgi:hypothetical protein
VPGAFACPSNTANSGGCWNENGKEGTTAVSIEFAADVIANGSTPTKDALELTSVSLVIWSSVVMVGGWYCTVVLAEPESRLDVPTFRMEAVVASDVDAAIDWNADLKACSCCCVGVSISVIVVLDPLGVTFDNSWIEIG